MAIDKVVSASIADDAVTSDKVSYNKNQFRNIIINGDMSIAQRATSVSSTGDGYKTCDRWRYERGVGTIDLSQSTTVPTGQGFAKSFKVDVTATASPSAGDVMTIEQRIEGQNLQYLKKGTSSAESTTLSFWVRSTKTGTYICELQDVDNSRSISKSYTISSSDTWEKKILTFAGDTTGALDNDNARSLDAIWYLSAGSNYTSGTLQTSWGSKVNANRAVGQVNFADNTSNDFYLTGCQLEAGTSTDFEFLPVDVNKRRCLRYYTQVTQNHYFAGDTTGALDNDNARSLDVIWYMSAGSNYTSGTLQTSWGSKVDANREVGQVNFADNTSNDFYLTGCQLETGTTASDFEFLTVDENLARCQRYFEKMLPENMVMLRYSGSSSFGRPGNFKVTKRATPTISREDGTAAIGAYDGDGSGGSSTASNWALNQADVEGFSLSATTPTSPDQFFMAMGGDHFFADSEL